MPCYYKGVHNRLTKKSVIDWSGWESARIREHSFRFLALQIGQPLANNAQRNNAHRKCLKVAGLLCDQFGKLHCMCRVLYKDSEKSGRNLIIPWTPPLPFVNPERVNEFGTLAVGI
jgi:hypothetical protein